MGAFNDGIRMGASAASSYEIEKSLRFEYGSSDTDGPYLTKTLGSGNLKTFTISVWIKKCTTPGAEGFADGQVIISNGGGGAGSYNGRLAFDTSDRLEWVQNNPAPTSHIKLQTSRKFRDCSSWYHIVLIQDTTQSSSGDRARLYVNGVRETVFDATTYPTQDYDGYFNNNTAHNIGSNAIWGTLSTRYANFNGYMSEFHFLDGTVKEPSNFGKTNVSTGEWIPIEYTGGSYGTNGFYLQFLDNSGTTATTLGKDTSGQGNNWTPNGFSVATGAANDSVTDTPTNNHCILNTNFNAKSSTEPVIKDGGLYSDNAGGGDDVTQGTIGVSSGKYYFEATCGAGASGGRHFVGWMLNEPDDGGSRIGGFYRSSGLVYNLAGTSTDHGVTYTTNDVIGCAIDADAGKVYFAKNNTWINSGNPPAGSGAAFTYTAGPALFPGIGMDNNANTIVWTVNFGQQGFAHTPPTGFKALTTKNLPTPTIKRGDKYFNTVLYTGNGSTQSITGVGFQPDLTWVKKRNSTSNHFLTDSVTGVNKEINTNQRNAQAANTNGITAFGSDGFSVGTDGGVNGNTDTFVAWNWKESATAGYDIVSYAGTGVARTVAHNLGVKPDMIIVKNIDDGNQEWGVYNSGLGATRVMFLDDDSAGLTNSIFWNNTEPTSSVFTVGTASTTNEDTLIAHVFASVAGYSKFGKYIGNGNVDGMFVYTGFKPAYVLVKRTNSGSSYWDQHDNKRNTLNVVNTVLYPNATDDEESYAVGTAGSPNINFLANGFKLESTHGEVNGSGDTYLYAAWAERSFKYANAR